jgi:hypothetical protein
MLDNMGSIDWPDRKQKPLRTRLRSTGHSLDSIKHVAYHRAYEGSVGSADA